jgi:hypothetical protein
MATGDRAHQLAPSEKLDHRQCLSVSREHLFNECKEHSLVQAGTEILSVIPITVTCC